MQTGFYGLEYRLCRRSREVHKRRILQHHRPLGPSELGVDCSAAASKAGASIEAPALFFSIYRIMGEGSRNKRTGQRCECSAEPALAEESQRADVAVAGKAADEAGQFQHGQLD